MPSRRAAWLLGIAAASGLVVYGSSLAALAGAASGVDRLFDASKIFAFSVPEDATWDWFTVAKVAALSFGLTVVIGFAIELSPSVRDGLDMSWSMVQRTLLGRRPAVVIGLG